MVTTRPNMTYNLPSGERATEPQPAVVSPSETWVLPSVKTAHPSKSLPFARVDDCLEGPGTWPGLKVSGIFGKECHMGGL